MNYVASTEDGTLLHGDRDRPVAVAPLLSSRRAAGATGRRTPRGLRATRRAQVVCRAG